MESRLTESSESRYHLSEFSRVASKTSESPRAKRTRGDIINRLALITKFETNLGAFKLIKS